jgi:SAM-dependent methyltransferase
MSATTDWGRFPVARMRRRTFLKRAAIHAELVGAALRRSAGGILEVGVGSGAQSALLSRLGGRVVALERDRRILRQAGDNLERFGRGIDRVAGDGFALPFRDATFGVAISQGLMEHFSDESIGRLLREQLRVCRSVVFSVPSDRYPRQDVGDERLLPPERWRRIVASAVPAGEHRVIARYYRWDLEALKYSLLARRRLGSFSVLVTIDPAGPAGPR